MPKNPIIIAILSVAFIAGIFALRVSLPRTEPTELLASTGGSALATFASRYAASHAASTGTTTPVPTAAVKASVAEGKSPAASKPVATSTVSTHASSSQSSASSASSPSPAPSAQQSAAQEQPSQTTQTTQAAQTTQTPPATETPQATEEAPASKPAEPASTKEGAVCNISVLGSDGLSPAKMIDRATCEKLNRLYQEGKAAGNTGDLYDNRDNLHVNFCVGWSPNPECPTDHRLFPQHEWRISGAGRATTPTGRPTLGQASYSGSVEGDVKHSILFDMYKSQSGADTLYNLYTANNLYVYPSLNEDSLVSFGPEVRANTENVANTPYVIGSKQICDCGAGFLRVHDASGSDLPFMELGFAGLAAFRPDVKQALIAKGMLMPTLQAMIRYSSRDAGTGGAYLSSVAHRSSYLAHYLEGGSPKAAFDAGKLVDMINGLTTSTVPPVAKLDVVSETFEAGEKLFTTPGAVARSVAQGTESREIVVSAAKSSDLSGSSGLEYRFVALDGDGSRVSIAQDGSKATLTFAPGDAVGRIDVGVFVRRQGGTYYSAPGIVSLYVRS